VLVSSSLRRAPRCARAVSRQRAGNWHAQVDVAKAVEANEAEFLLALGRAGGGEERDDEHVQWTIGGELDEYGSVLAGGFGEGPPEAAWVCEMYRRIGLDDDTWRHFVGRIDGSAVACATTFFASGVVGLYFVCTSPDARRRGVGAAISRTALVDARDDGMRVGVLGSSPMGQRVYERLGFRTVCDLHVYEWSPVQPIAMREA
jgi:ribosomal protein S18 acetylase RimI-like enzyme